MQFIKSFFKIILIMSVGFFFVSCSGPDNVVPTETRDDNIEDLVTDDLIRTAQFAGVGRYTVNGAIELFHDSDTDQYSLLFTDFLLMENGPDLHVYLSEGDVPVNFLDLGELKSTNGIIRYDFDGSSFDPAFDHVLIWCQRFSVNFGQGVLVDP